MSTEGDPPGGPPPPDAPPPEGDATVAAEPSAATESSAAKSSAATEPQPPNPLGRSPGGSPPPAPEAGRGPDGDSSEPEARGRGENPFREAPPATDDSILPTRFDEDDLQDAVGARRRKKIRSANDDEPVDEDGLPDEKRRSRRMIVVIALALVFGLGVAALAVFGRINSQRFLLNCTATQAIAEQGRKFPPWGSTPLPGAEWKPIALPPNAQCKPAEVDDRAQLEALFLDLLLERTSATLTARNFLDAGVVDGKPAASSLDLTTMQLEQALLLSRGPERGDQRKQVERLQGDVQYWRASLRLRDATTAMSEAARQFDQAALARPMHVSDAGAWATFLRRVGDELQAGPNGVPTGFPPAPTGDRPGSPAGTALPVEPVSSAGSADAPAPPPDAGVPTGGVLL